MIKINNDKKQRRRFSKKQLDRIEDVMDGLDVTSDEYGNASKRHDEIYKELYSGNDKTVDTIVKIVSILVPAAMSAFFACYSYHKNENYDSKDGDSWLQALELKRSIK